MGTNYGDGTGRSIPLRDHLILNEPEEVEAPEPEPEPKPAHQIVTPQPAGMKGSARSGSARSKDDGGEDFKLTGQAARGGTKDGK